MNYILTAFLATYIFIEVTIGNTGGLLPTLMDTSSLEVKSQQHKQANLAQRATGVQKIGINRPSRYEESIQYSFTSPGSGYIYLNTGSNAEWQGQVTLSIHNYSSSAKTVDLHIYGQCHIISIDSEVGGDAFNWDDTEFRFRAHNSAGELMDPGADASVTFTVKINYTISEGWTGVEMYFPNYHAMNSTDDIVYFIK
jgi:hypothetical protein